MRPVDVHMLGLGFRSHAAADPGGDCDTLL